MELAEKWEIAGRAVHRPLEILNSSTDAVETFIAICEGLWWAIVLEECLRGLIDDRDGKDAYFTKRDADAPIHIAV